MRELLSDIGKRLLTLLVIFALITYGLAALQRQVSDEAWMRHHGIDGEVLDRHQLDDWSNAYILENENCYCGWQNEYDEKSGLCRFYLSVFTEGEDGRYTRTDEEQCERCYTKEALIRALQGAGFGDLQFFGGTDGRAATDTDERWFVRAICKK